jgi:predicted nucleic acid-binding protein
MTIAIDTSSLVAYLEGVRGPDTPVIEAAIDAQTLRIPGPVVTELLSYPGVGAKLAAAIDAFPIPELRSGFWERAGETRRKVLSKGLKAKIADALITQTCLDHDMELITRDGDFHHFVKHCGLKLAV